MKEKIAERLQKKLERISLNSVGKSVPVTMYERKIPKEVLKKLEMSEGNNR